MITAQCASDVEEMVLNSAHDDTLIKMIVTDMLWF